MGPVIAWKHGWDDGNETHQAALLDLQLRFRPRIVIWTVADTRWMVDESGLMVPANGDSLNFMCVVAEQQVDQGARTRMLPDARAVARSVEAAPTPPQGLPSPGA